MIFGLEYGSVRAARSGSVRQAHGVSAAVARSQTEYARREPEQLVRVTAYLGKTLHFLGSESASDVGVFRLNGGTILPGHGDGFSDLARRKRKIYALRLLR